MVFRFATPAAVLAALCSLTSCTTAKPPLETRQDRFINVVRVLADSGRLGEPAEVEHLLRTRLTEVKRYSFPLTPDACRTPDADRFRETTAYQPAPGFWFKETPEGRPKMFVPGWLGPGGPVGKPSFTYEVTRTLGCSEPPTAQPRVSADLRFDNVPAFSCVGEADLHRALPQTKFRPATDGAWLYGYEGPRLDTWVTFDFVYPPECMINVSLEQSPRVRQIRAERN